MSFVDFKYLAPSCSLVLQLSERTAVVRHGVHLAAWSIQMSTPTLKRKSRHSFSLVMLTSEATGVGLEIKGKKLEDKGSHFHLIFTCNKCRLHVVKIPVPWPMNYSFLFDRRKSSVSLYFSVQMGDLTIVVILLFFFNGVWLKLYSLLQRRDRYMTFTPRGWSHEKYIKRNPGGREIGRVLCVFY